MLPKNLYIYFDVVVNRILHPYCIKKRQYYEYIILIQTFKISTTHYILKSLNQNIYSILSSYVIIIIISFSLDNHWFVSVSDTRTYSKHSDASSDIRYYFFRFILQHLFGGATGSMTTHQRHRSTLFDFFRTSNSGYLYSSVSYNKNNYVFSKLDSNHGRGTIARKGTRLKFYKVTANGHTCF